MSRRNVVGLLALTLWSCAPSSTGQDASVEPGADAGADAGATAPGVLLRSTRPRVMTPAPSADVSLAVQDANELTLKLLRSVPASGNVAVSPWSVELALAMASAGGAGTTQHAFAAVLHPSLPDARFHAAMNTIDQSLLSRAPEARDAGTFALDVNDGLFTALGLQPQPAFLDTLAESYGAGVRQVDFAGAPETARSDINGWVKDTTRGLIPELLAPGTVSSATRLALVNTLDFQARWRFPFDPNVTHNGAFTRLAGTTTQVPMMAGCYVLWGIAVVAGVDPARALLRRG